MAFQSAHTAIMEDRAQMALLAKFKEWEPGSKLWWGFLRGDGAVILKPWVHRAELDETQDTMGVCYVRGPFVSSSIASARAKLGQKIKDAQRKAA